MKAFLSKIIKKGNGGEEVQDAKKPSRPSEQERKKEEFVPVKRRFDSQSDQQEDQILNCLINMGNLLKITKINRQLKGQYLTICHLNRMLCEDIIPINQLKLFLLNKTGESANYEKDLHLKGKNMQTKGLSGYYIRYSNGLIFQYYSVRALLWKVSLGYLPISKNKWISIIEGNLLQYLQYVKEYIVDNVLKKKKRNSIKKEGEETEQHQLKKEGQGGYINLRRANDHPLNREKQSKWKNYFQDYELWNLIQKDTIRTRPTCKFFQQQFDMEIGSQQAELQIKIERHELHLSKSKSKSKTYYYDCLTRIIYIYLKNHPERSYSQGMNQLASLIFYSFTNKNSQYFRRVAESDAYFCFQIIMGDLLKSPSSDFLGGERYSRRFEEMLKKIDLRLFQSLESQNNLTNLRLVSIKWFNGYFLNEFEIDQCLILWDGFIAIGGTQQRPFQVGAADLLLYLGLAVVHLNRQRLDEGQNPLLVFQKIRDRPESILEKAISLFKIFHSLFQ